MFIPIVPFVPHTTVINETIVYSDTVLPLKDSGNNLKVCSISNVSEYSLERCLKKIFESNPDVIFNTIQYSKNDKKVYFYTDKNISTQAWEKSKITKHKPLSNSKKILEEVSELLLKGKNKDADCISLYDVAKLIKKFRNSYDYVIEKYENYFEELLEEEFDDSSIIIYDFDYKKNQLKIGFQFSMDFEEDYDDIVFTKENGDLYIVKSKSLFAQEILTHIGKGLSTLYDELIKFSNFKSQSTFRSKSSNSNFLVNIDEYGVDICIISPSNRFSNDFQLSSLSYENGYDYECNSTSVLAALKGNEDEIFKRIFVRVDDCPEWSKQLLYQIRQEQLVEERKSQKRLEIKRKFFPWINK